MPTDVGVTQGVPMNRARRSDGAMAHTPLVNRPSLTALATRVLAVGLVAALSSGSAAAVPLLPEVIPAGDSRTLGAAHCPDAVARADEAAARAAACAHDVEILDARTVYDTQYATAHGTTRLEVSTLAVRTDITGVWQPVDPTLVMVGDRIEVASPVVAMSFGGGDDSQLATIEHEGTSLSIDAPFAMTAPVLDGAMLTYPEVLPGVDMIVVVDSDATGFSQALRVSSPEAAAHPALAELEFPVEAAQGLELREADGALEVVDADRDVVLHSPVPVMWDSSGSKTGPSAWRGGAVVPDNISPDLAFDAPPLRVTSEKERASAPQAGDAVAELGLGLESGAVVVTPDAELLTATDTVWPVYIDPEFYRNAHEWTWVSDGYSPQWKFSPDQGVGRCDRPTSSTCPKTFRSRLVYEFTNMNTMNNLVGSDIVSAEFSVYGTHSYSCSKSTVEAYRVNNISQSTGWSDAGPWTSARLLDARYVAHKPGCANSLPQWVEFDAKEAVRFAADSSNTTLSIGLKAADETTMTGWKRYRKDAKLTIEYNRAPNTPTSAVLTTTSGTAACVTGAGRPAFRDERPTLNAVVSDPDGDNSRAQFEILTTSGSSVWKPALTTAAASGTNHSRRVPSGTLSERSYRWTVHARDTASPARTSATKTCEFRLDLTPPVAPRVTSVPVATLVAGGHAAQGQAAVYPQSAPTGGTVMGGGIGKTGGFQIDENGSTDVVRFHYSFNNDAKNRSVSAPLGFATITHTPTKVGVHTLHVQSEDEAGHKGPETVFRYIVAFTTVVGDWRLDEGSGTQAADISGVQPPNPLTVSTSTQWVNGPGAEFGTSAADKALRFDATNDVASAGRPIYDTRDSFTVTALVKLDSTTGTRAAVSQGGFFANGFALGHRNDASCPTGVASCWAFWMDATDVNAPSVTAARSAVPVQTGTWVGLIGIHNAGNDTLRLYVCKPSAVDAVVPVASASTSFTASWIAGGSFQLGHGLVQGAPGQHWFGSVDRVRIHDGVLGDDALRQSCNPA